MPKMTHWNSPDPVEVAPAKVAVYAAQGWVQVGVRAPKVQPAVVRDAPVVEDVVEQAPVPAKKAPAKKTAAKKASKKS